jgi:hypothetical protein
VTPDIARALRMSAVVAQRASADMARRVESLCDHDLAVIDRAEVTGQLTLTSPTSISRWRRSRLPRSGRSRRL